MQKERYYGTYVDMNALSFTDLIYEYRAVYRSLRSGSYLIYRKSAHNASDIKIGDIEKVCDSIITRNIEAANALSNPNNIVIIQNSPVTLDDVYYLKIIEKTEYNPHATYKLCELAGSKEVIL